MHIPTDDVSGHALTTLTLASVMANGSLALVLTEQFGNLANQEKILSSTTRHRLVGSYANAMAGVAVTSLVFTFFYLALFFYRRYTLGDHKVVNTHRKIYWAGLLLALVTGLASASINLYLLEDFQKLNNISYDPPATPGSNYKLRGPLGNAILSLGAISLGFAASTWFGQIYDMYMDYQHHRHGQNSAAKPRFDDDYFGDPFEG